MLTDHLWYPTEKIFVNGHWKEPDSGNHVELVNPSNGETIANIAQGNSRDIESSVSAALNALKGPWGKSTAVQRGRLLLRLSDLVKKRLNNLAYIESVDVGKPLWHVILNSMVVLATR